MPTPGSSNYGYIGENINGVDWPTNITIRKVIHGDSCGTLVPKPTVDDTTTLPETGPVTTNVMANDLLQPESFDQTNYRLTSILQEGTSLSVYTTRDGNELVPNITCATQPLGDEDLYDARKSIICTPAPGFDYNSFTEGWVRYQVKVQELSSNYMDISGLDQAVTGYLHLTKPASSPAPYVPANPDPAPASEPTPTPTPTPTAAPKPTPTLTPKPTPTPGYGDGLGAGGGVGTALTPEEQARLEEERRRQLAATGASDTTALFTASLLATAIGAASLRTAAIISRRQQRQSR